MNIPNPPVRESMAQANNTFSLPWLNYFSNVLRYLSSIPRSDQALPNYANDAAAAAGGVQVNGFYRNGSVVMQRIV